MAGNIFVMAPDGGDVVQLTHGAFADQRPTFSPGGSTVVFVSDREDRVGLWRVPSDGTGSPEPQTFDVDADLRRRVAGNASSTDPLR